SIRGGAAEASAAAPRSVPAQSADPQSILQSRNRAILQFASCRHPDFFENCREDSLRAPDRQVADVEMPGADVGQRPNGSGAYLLGAGAGSEFARKLLDRDRQELFERVERTEVGTPVEEHAKHAWQRDPTAAGGRNEARDVRGVVMAYDLREIKLGVESRCRQVVGLTFRIGMRGLPASKRERSPALPQQLAQLPCMRQRTRRSDRLVAAEDDEGGKPVLLSALGIRDAILERVLRRQEGHDALARHIASEIRDEMTQVVFLLRTDGAVGEKD